LNPTINSVSQTLNHKNPGSANQKTWEHISKKGKESFQKITTSKKKSSSTPRNSNASKKESIEVKEPENNNQMMINQAIPPPHFPPAFAHPMLIPPPYYPYPNQSMMPFNPNGFPNLTMKPNQPANHSNENGSKPENPANLQSNHSTNNQIQNNNNNNNNNPTPSGSPNTPSKPLNQQESPSHSNVPPNFYCPYPYPPNYFFPQYYQNFPANFPSPGFQNFPNQPQPGFPGFFPGYPQFAQQPPLFYPNNNNHNENAQKMEGNVKEDKPENGMVKKEEGSIKILSLLN